MAYIGNTQQDQNYVPAIDYFSGNGSTVAFTLSRPVASVAQVQAVIENVPQNPGDAYTVSGNTITFTSAPPSGTNNIYIYYTSPNTQVVQPGQGTVGTIQMADGVTVNFNDGSAAAPSITNTGDTNTGIFFPTADTIAFSEGGVESMRIDANGNVGIGTSSPTEKLAVRTTGINGFSVSGNITSTPATLDAGQLSLISLNSPLSGTTFSAGDNRLMTFGVSPLAGYPYIRGSNLQYYADNNHVFVNAGTERMRIDSSGNVGIGTSSPTQLLDVTTGSGGSIAITAKTSTSSQILNIGLDPTNGAYFGTYTNQGLRLITNSSERMRITSNGGISFGSSGTNFGTSGQVLQSNGDAAPSWVNASAFAAGTRLAFQQTSAPTGWTKDTTAAINDSILRLVTGSVTSGGSTAFSTFNGQTATGATTLATSQIPSHTHGQGTGNAGQSPFIQGGSSFGAIASINTTGAAGGGGSHTHGVTTSIKYYDFIIASKD